MRRRTAMTPSQPSLTIAQSWRALLNHTEKSSQGHARYGHQTRSEAHTHTGRPTVEQYRSSTVAGLDRSRPATGIHFERLGRKIKKTNVYPSISLTRDVKVKHSHSYLAKSMASLCGRRGGLGNRTRQTAPVFCR